MLQDYKKMERFGSHAFNHLQETGIKPQRDCDELTHCSMPIFLSKNSAIKLMDKICGIVSRSYKTEYSSFP
jgi:hypothetical protein